MGQGAWTAFAQIAADGLGLDMERMEFRSGTSDLPDAGIAGGSAHTATAGMAIHNAGAAVIARLAAASAIAFTNRISTSSFAPTHRGGSFP